MCLWCVCVCVLVKVLSLEEWGDKATDSAAGPLMFIPAGDACKACKELWEACYRLIFTWGEFCHKQRHSNIFATQVTMALKTMKGQEQRIHFLEAVMERIQAGRTVYKPEI